MRYESLSSTEVLPSWTIVGEHLKGNWFFRKPFLRDSGLPRHRLT